MTILKSLSFNMESSFIKVYIRIYIFWVFHYIYSHGLTVNRNSLAPFICQSLTSTVCARLHHNVWIFAKHWFVVFGLSPTYRTDYQHRKLAARLMDNHMYIDQHYYCFLGCFHQWHHAYMHMAQVLLVSGPSLILMTHCRF